MGTGRIIKPFLFVFFLLIFFGILLTTVPPAVYVGDSGETISCCCTLGIQHPPGYPLFSLIGKIFTFLPLGDMSYRIYIFSLFLSGVCFALLLLFFTQISKILKVNDRYGVFSVTAASLFVTGFSIWEQSATAKGGIYIMNIAFTILLSYLLFKAAYSAAEKNRNRLFLLFFFLYGLSFGNHHMSQIAVAPAYALLLFKAGFFSRKNLLNPLIYLLLFAGFSVYLYLPLRAGSAILNWGDPSTLANFLDVFSRSQYIRSEIAKSMAAPFIQSGKFFTQFAKENTIAGALLCVAGFIYTFRKDRITALYLTAIPAIFLVVTAFYLNLSSEKLYIMETYITPSYFPLAVFAAIGLYWATAFLKRMSLPAAAAAGISLLAFCVLSFYPVLDRSRYFFARDYNMNMLDTLERNSLIFVTGDGIVFPCWYLKYVKKYRPDVTLIGSAVLPMKWVRDNITRQNPEVRVPEVKNKNIGTESTGYIMDAIIKMNLGKFNIYLAYNLPEQNAIDPALTIMPKGLIWKILPKQYAYVSDMYVQSSRNMWKFYNLRGVFGDYRGGFNQLNESLYLKDYGIAANSTGTFFEDQGFNDLALESFTRAHMLAPADNEFVYNMGNAYFNLGDPTEAVNMYNKSLEIDPTYENAWYNLGVVNYKTGNYAEALRCFKKLKEINPGRTDADSIINILEKTQSPAG
jgi:tetratricopeptide (TPR) repeat protein